MLINRPNPPFKLTHIERVTHYIDLVADQLNVATDVMFCPIDAIDRSIERHFLVFCAPVVGHIKAADGAFAALCMPEIDDLFWLNGPIEAIFDAKMLELLHSPEEVFFC